MRREILLPPKNSKIFKSNINVPVPSLLFFSNCATCITSAAASLTTKSSFCSSKITHFHRPRVSDNPIFICGEKLEFYFLDAFKEVRELCFQRMKSTGKPLRKRLAIRSEYFQHVWTLSRWQTRLGLNSGQQIRERASLSGFNFSHECSQFSTFSRSVEFLFGNFKNSVAGDWSLINILIMDLLLRSAWSRVCQTKLSSATASSAGHKCHSLLETATFQELPVTSFSHIHLSPPLTSMPCQPYTHSQLETSLIHGVITRTQLGLTPERSAKMEVLIW